MPIYLLPGVGFGIRDGEQRKMFKCSGSIAQLRNVAAIVSQLIAEKKITFESSETQTLAEKLFYEWKKLKLSNKNNEIIESTSFDNCLNIDSSALASLAESTEGQRSLPFPNLQKVKQKILDYGYRIEEKNLEVENCIVSIGQITNTPVVLASNGEVIAEGKGLTQESKLKSLIGEAVERICAGNSDYSRVVTGLSPDDLLAKGYTVPFFDCTSRDLYKGNLCIDWVQGELYPAQPAWLPAEKVWHQHEPLSGVFGFDLRTTVGLASGATFTDGFANGLLEAIEKDAYALVMRCRICCPDIEMQDVLNCGSQVQEILESLNNLGIETHFKWISLDWPIPIAHVLLLDKKERIPAHSHGCSAALSSNIAITRALLEAIQVYSGLSALASREWVSITTRGECGYMKPQHAWSDPLFRPALRHLMNRSQFKYDNYKLSLKKSDWKISSIKEFCDWLTNNKFRIFTAAVGSIEDIKVVRVYVEGLVIPDNYVENMSNRLDSWLTRLDLPGPYTDPILS